MAVTWKALAYSSEVTSAVTSEGVVRSTADSSLTVTVSTADSKAVSAGTAASTADSKAVSEGVVRSTADSSLTVTVSTADSKAVSAGTAASVADSKAVSEGVVRSTADSSLTVTVSTADSKAVSAGTLAGSHAARHKNGGLDEILLNEFGEPTGAVAFDGQQATNFVLHTATTSNVILLTPVVGKLAFSSDELAPYICTVAV